MTDDTSPEDETFRRLCQTPFRELIKVLGLRLLDDELDIQQTLADHNWTYKEYKIALSDHIHRSTVSSLYMIKTQLI